MGFIIYWQKYSCVLLLFCDWIYFARSIKQNQRQIYNAQIFRIQDPDSIMCGFYCIAFIEYMLSGKAFSDYTNLFSPNDHQKNDRIIYEYFQDKYDKRKRKP